MGFNFQEIAEIADIRKNARETVRLRRVAINGTQCIDIRSFYKIKESDVNLSPTKKGLTLSLPVALKVVSALFDALNQGTDTTGTADASDNEPMEVEYVDREPDAPPDYEPARMVHDSAPEPDDDLDPNEDEPF